MLRPFSKGGTLRLRLFAFLLLINLSVCLLARAQDTDQPNNPPPQPTPRPGGDFAVDNPDAEKLPTDVILVKGAVPSATDSSTPVPESGTISEKNYVNRYFDLSYLLPPNWHQKYMGPPPSDTGYYVLAQIEPNKDLHGAKTGTMLIAAQDMFFSRNPIGNARDMVSFRKAALSTTGADYVLERQPSEVSMGGHTFYRMDYMSPAAELHWYTMTTEIRCHTVEFTLTSRDTSVLESLVKSIEKLNPVAIESGTTVPETPICIRDYASGSNVLHKVVPMLTDRRFNPIPVRLTIDRYGRVKHIHVISAFPDQAKVITDALLQWEFKPYKKKTGELAEVETGIMFGTGPARRTANSPKD
jgi:hypothetical protein